MAIWAFLFLLIFVIKIVSKIWIETRYIYIFASQFFNVLPSWKSQLQLYNQKMDSNHIHPVYQSLLLHLELSFLSLIFKLTYIHAQHNIINVASSSIYFRLGMTFLANWEKESWISSVTKFDGFRTMHAISKITSS